MKRKALPYIILTGQVILTVVAAILRNPGHTLKMYVILAGLSFYIVGLMITIDSDFNQNKSLNIGKRFLNISRLIRHEFQNHLQVLFSMIQLKKYQDALKYIEDVVNSDKTINHICYSLTDPLLICCLLEIIYSFRQKDINITVEVLDKSPGLPQLSNFKRELQKYILQFDKILGKKDIKIVLKNSKVEVLSNALGIRTTY